MESMHEGYAVVRGSSGLVDKSPPDSVVNDTKICIWKDNYKNLKYVCEVTCWIDGSIGVILLPPGIITDGGLICAWP